MEVNPKDLDLHQLFNLMTGSIVPRPIAWISTMARDGTLNLAPYSMFTGVCAKPPTVVFCPGYHEPYFREKDTFRNIAATGEFVVNFVNTDTVDAMNLTALELAPEVDEFKMAGVTPVPSQVVKPPRVAESPISFECTLHEIVTIGLTDGGGHIVIGTVVNMHFNDGVCGEDMHLDFDAYRPIGGLVGHTYANIDTVFGE